MKIGNIKTKATNNKKAFNKDLFLFDREELNEDRFNEIKANNEGLIYLGSEKTTNKLVEKVIIFLQDDTKGKTFLPYSLSVISTSYQGQKQTNCMLQALTLNGFNWLMKSNNVFDTLKDDTMILKYYTMLLETQVALKDNKDNLCKYSDYLDLSELSNNGNWLTLELEDEKNKIKILFNSNGYLWKIEKEMITTAESIKSAFGFDSSFIDVDETNEDKEIKELKKSEDYREIKPLFGDN